MVEQISWQPTNENVLASTSNDKTIKIWDIRTPQSFKSEKTKGTSINLAWRPDGNTIAVGILLLRK